MIRHGLSRLPGIKTLGQSMPGVRNAFAGVFDIVQVGVGFGSAYYTYGHNYGTGTAAIYGVASALPWVGLGIGGIEMGKSLGDHFYMQQKNRKLNSFSNSQQKVQDNYGSLGMMRQNSIQQLSRHKIAHQRVLGNEAYYLSRR